MSPHLSFEGEPMSYSSLATIMAAPLDPERREGTGYPWWAIVRRTSGGAFILLDGPFFSREEAENLRTSKPHDYGKSSLVYCFSGHRSESYKDLILTAQRCSALEKGNLEMLKRLEACEACHG